MKSVSRPGVLLLCLGGLISTGAVRGATGSSDSAAAPQPLAPSNVPDSADTALAIRAADAGPEILRRLPRHRPTSGRRII